MTEPAGQPPKRERSLLGFYIGLGVVAGLFGLGALLYRPLRLRYVIYRLENCDKTPLRQSISQCWLWYDECAQAASAGNRRALETVIDCRDVPIRAEPNYRLYDIAATRPDEFFACLGQRSDQAVTATLKDLAAATGYASWHQRSVETDWKTRLANLSMDQGTSASPQVRRVAAAALRFARQRIPYEFDKDATPVNEVGAPLHGTGPEE